MPAGVSGRYFDARSSRPRDAALDLDVGGGLLLRWEGGERRARANDFEVSDRILNLPRRVTFGNGAVFETTDNDGMDALLVEAQPQRRTQRFVHALERAWPAALASAVAVVLIAFGFFRWGIPAVAATAARVLPNSVDEAIGGQSLALLDRTVFSTSRLAPERKLQLQQMFARMTEKLDDGRSYFLAPRDSPRVGANALALPSGIIVITDQLVELVPHDAQNGRQGDEELMAVLAHEIGHVRGRHSLRMLFQAAGVSMMAAAILGDVTSVVGIAGMAPVLLQAKNSRDFEREADAFARTWLAAHGIPETRFDSALCRLAASHERGPPRPDTFEYLATHPAVAERAKCPLPPSTSDK